MPRCIEAIQAAQLNGRTMPVVPKIDRPFSIPSLGFQVFFAIFSPSGIDIVTFIFGNLLKNFAVSLIISLINFLGIGLIAGSPTGIGNPGLVTIPTPGPAQNLIPLSVS